jgi:hypothetical protein
MRKFSSLSKVTAAAVLGSVILTGCGAFGSGDAATTTPPPAVETTVNAADGYVINLNGHKATAFCSDTNMTYESTEDQNVSNNGKLTFAGVTLTDQCTITVGADAYIDVNNNGSFDANDTQIGFDLKAPGDAEYVSQLTTLVVAMIEEAQDLNTTAKAAKLVEAATLKTAVKSFNPVTAATSVATSTDSAVKLKAQKLMMLGEVLKTAMKSATKTQLSKISTATFTDTTTALASVDVNTTLASTGMDSTTLSAVTTKAAAIKSVVEILDKIDTTKIDVNTLVTNMSDGGASLSTALVSSAQTGVTVDANSTASFVKSGQDVNVTAIDTAVNTATAAVASTPAKLSLGSSLTVGSEVISLNSGKFTHTVDTNASTTIANFYNIALSSATLSKDINATDSVSLTVTIKDNNNNQVSLSLPTVDLSSVSKVLKVEIPANSDVIITSSGLDALSRNASASITSKMTNTDLSFDVSSILNNLSTTNIADEITALNNYLSTANVYDVNLTIGGLDNFTADYTTITGTITVE